MKQILGIILITVITSCLSNSEKKEIKYDYLLAQKSLDGKYMIYKYYRPGSMAFSREIYGTQIQKVDNGFRENGGINVKGDLIKFIGIDTKEIYRKKLGQQPTDTIPIIKYEKAYDLTLKVLEYDGHNGQNSRELYFDYLLVTDRNIQFIGVKSGLGKEFNDMVINLGSVELETNSDTITKISYKTIQVSMNGRKKYKDGTFNENLPSIKIITNSLIPNAKLYLKDFENRNGIYYDIKEVRDNNNK
jgi:hypothetical protein